MSVVTCHLGLSAEYVSKKGLNPPVLVAGCDDD